jgi:PAS domain S-box-containing protein
LLVSGASPSAGRSRRVAHAALVVSLLLSSVFGPVAADARPPTRHIHEILDQPWQVVDLLDNAGLASAYVFDMDFTKEGIAWLATNIGLYRYDGYTWQRFTTRDGLPTEFVRSVRVTRAGELWVGTSHGAGVFDGKRFDPRGADKGLAGPSVRRIIEDPDGTLWFCSDRWPEPRVNGGLTMMRAGKWRRFGHADGIAEELVHNYFRDSHGRQFALTIGGIFERTAAGSDGSDRWERLRHAGLASEALTSWQMVELPTGELVVQQAGRVIAQHDGRWVAVPHDRGPLVVTRTGELFSAAQDAGRGTFVFERWVNDPERFVPASSEVDVQDVPTEVLRQAPDGSIWCVGKSILLRWRYTSAPWTAFAGLPPLQGADADGRIWFADASSAWTMGDGAFERVPGVHGPLTFTTNGEVWAQSHDGFVRFANGIRTSISRETAGLASIRHTVRDIRGHLWFEGMTASGAPVVRWFDGSNWHTPSPSVSADYFILNPEPDPQRGIWLTMHETSTDRWVIGRIESNALSILPTDALPPLQHPSLIIRPERIYLYDYTGLYVAENAALRKWRRLDLPIDTGVVHLTLPDVSWLLFSGTRPGRRGVAAAREGRWSSVPVDWRGTATPGPGQTLLLPTIRGFSIVRSGQANSPDSAAADFVAVPGTAAITRVVEDHHGAFWIATNAYVLRYQPDRAPLLPSITSAMSEGRSDREFHATFSARRRYELPNDAERFQYSWRIDEQPWSSFAPVDTVKLPPGFASAGTHRLSVQVRDAHGAASARPATVAFTLLPVPLQERAWFWPLIGAFATLLLYTTASAWSARQRLARQARGLEEKVRERTEQLEQDIVERERAEAALRETGQQFRGVFDSAFQMICVFTPEGIVQETNQTALEMMGATRDELIGRPAWEMRWWTQSADLQQQLRDAIARAARGELVHFEADHPQPDGMIVTVDCSIKRLLDEEGRVRFLVAEGRDITGRKQSERDRTKLETQLRQAQKMEAIGTLAGGIAHDFNNLLTSIFGNTEVASLKLPTTHPVQDHLQELLHAAHRARDLVNQILIFSRRQEQERRALQLGPIVLEALKLMRATVPTTIEIKTDIGKDQPWVLVDPVQIHQVVMNLCTNAAHAMRDGGRLEVSLTGVQIDAEFARLHPKLHAGLYARLMVTDTGSGIDPKHIDRIFEPFFSTKPQGQGTGLGLSVVHGIMANHDGAITVYSQLGHGTTFRLYFPAADVPMTAALPTSVPAFHGKGQRILVVDDEVAVADVAVRMLECAGYAAKSYTDPQSALIAFEANPDHFQLVLTDLTMPKLTGIDLARQLRRIRPDIRIVLGSGFTDHVGEERVKQAGVSELIAKPYTMHDLAETVRHVLERPAGGGSLKRASSSE